MEKHTKELNINIAASKDTETQKDIIMDTYASTITSIPEWATNILSDIKDIGTQQKVDSLTLNSISLSNTLLEAKLDEALIEASISKKDRNPRT